jgi:hypothetical protein
MTFKQLFVFGAYASRIGDKNTVTLLFGKHCRSGTTDAATENYHISVSVCHLLSEF